MGLSLAPFINHSIGACADCHAPGSMERQAVVAYTTPLAWPIPMGSLRCLSQVSDVDMSGCLALVSGWSWKTIDPGMLTFEWMLVFYGPLMDVPNVVMGGSWQPKFKESFCAGCHEQDQPALITGQSLDVENGKWPALHSTFSEWESGLFNQNRHPVSWLHAREHGTHQLS